VSDVTGSIAGDEPAGSKRGKAWAIVGFYGTVIAAAILLLAVHLPVDLNPARTAGRSTGKAGVCATTLDNDDLTHLSLRTAERAERRIQQWKRCQPSILKRAEDALRWDYLLVAVIAAGLIGGVVQCLGAGRRRWRWSACFAIPFVGLYVLSEIAENEWLRAQLEQPKSDWPDKIQWASAIKFGALAGALPIFFIALVLAVAEAVSPLKSGELVPAGTPAGGSKPAPVASPSWRARFRRVWSNSTEWNTRLSTAPEATDEPEREGTKPLDPFATALVALADVRAIAGARGKLGVACSGGGIRSAALNLGALQALDVARHDGESSTEMERVRWMSAVSGGSYIASAWVSARAGAAVPTRPTPWSRGSPEEDHLRRHASYIAPGVAGKFWAFLRVLLGITMNVLLISLVVAAVALPYGWGVARAQERVPASGGGSIKLASSDATIRLPSTRILIAVPGETVRLAHGATARLRDGLPVVSVGSDGKAPTAKVEVTDSEGQTTESSVTGTGSADVNRDVGGGKVATGAVEIAAGADASSPHPAAIDGRKLSSGSEVRVAPRVQHIEVEGRVLGCLRSEKLLTEMLQRLEDGSDKPARYHCDPQDGVAAMERIKARAKEKAKANEDGKLTAEQRRRFGERKHRVRQRSAHYVTVGDGAELVTGEKTTLTLKGDAVVDEGFLLKACGAHQCERLGWPALKKITWGLLGLALALGIITVVARSRERMNAASQRAFRIAAITALALAALVLVLPELVSWAEGERWGIEERSRVTGLSVLTVIVALISQIVPALGSGSDPKDPGKVVASVKKLGTRLKPILVRIAVYLAVPILLLALVLFVASSASQRGATPTQVALWLAAVGTLLILSAGADLNQWSFHPYYRERLASAFGVDPDTLMPRGPERLQDFPTPSDATIDLEVCAAANISDGRITSPGRPVAPWAFSARTIGTPGLRRVFKGSKGTVQPKTFSGKLEYLQTLWTAVAVSGAAFSPAMGKMTRPERALMALANLRLGVWYPNPAMLATHPSYFQAHHPTPVYLAKEAFGLHRATDPWVYVTDGGHYENLGLMALLREPKQCREIYCFDASGDAIDTFGTIAEAMRLAREELDIEIEFDPTHLRPNDKGISPLGVFAGTVTYPNRSGLGDDRVGWIVFAKLEVPKGAPFDIVDLARTLPKFPNNPTTDQLYTDQKFEAYRALGFYLGEQAAKLGQDIRSRMTAGSPIDDAVKAANEKIAPKDKPDETHVVLKVSPDP
jgi:hypothetical protein